jgi:peptidoglycan-associated lipoprotein
MNTFSTFRRTSLAATTSLLFLIATGCHKQSSSIAPTALAPSAEAPPTASLTADPAAIDLGGSVVLNWRTANANTVTIDGIGQVNPNGTQTVSPANSTIFHLVAKGDGGTTEANVRVTVRVPEAPVADNSSMADMGSDAEFHAHVQDLFFDYDSYDLRPDAQTAAQQDAAYLASHPAIRIVIGGYCDDRGSAEYNLALGENRANSAKTALVNAGVSPARIRVVSYGNEKQFCTQQTESCWQENRRAQFSLDR